jgi:hypothetical protein
MKTLLYSVLASLACIFFSATMKGQTPIENLQTAVEIYNAMKEYGDGLNAKTVDQSNIDDMKARMDKGIVLLDKVIREGNADQIKVARYFRNNFKYEYGFVLGMKGQNALAFEVMKEIEKDVTSFISTDFPLRYQFFEKNYIIKWENFAPTQAEFLTGMAEICYNLGKYEDAIRVNKKAIAHPNTTDWLRYISVNKMLDIYSKNNSLLSAEENTQFALQAILEYDKLNEANKETVKENNYPTVKRAAGILLAYVPGNPTPQAINRCAEAAPIVAKYDPDNPNTLSLFEICYKYSYNGTPAWDRAASDFAKAAHTKLLTAQPADFGASKRARYVGIAAADHIAANTADADCRALQDVAAMYKYWNQTDKESTYLNKAKICTENNEKAAAKAAKAARRANSNFNFYVGANILPLINTNPKRDYGGVVNLVFNKSALEFGYTKIRRNKENIFDLWIAEVDDADQDNISRWDGYKLHFQPKFFTKSKQGYFGILVGYNEKNFDSLTVNTVHDVDGAYSLQTFKPGVKQYVGMFNMGGLFLTKGFGMDISFGVGANYSKFDPGNALDRSEYTIENPLLENRKDSYWGIFFRAGLTMGLNFGRGNN